MGVSKIRGRVWESFKMYFGRICCMALAITGGVFVITILFVVAMLFGGNFFGFFVGALPIFILVLAAGPLYVGILRLLWSYLIKDNYPASEAFRFYRSWKLFIKSAAMTGVFSLIFFIEIFLLVFIMLSVRSAGGMLLAIIFVGIVSYISVFYGLILHLLAVYPEMPAAELWRRLTMFLEGRFGKFFFLTITYIGYTLALGVVNAVLRLMPFLLGDLISAFLQVLLYVHIFMSYFVFCLPMIDPDGTLFPDFWYDPLAPKSPVEYDPPAVVPPAPETSGMPVNLEKNGMEGNRLEEAAHLAAVPEAALPPMDMQMPAAPLEVAAAILRREGKILICRRGAGGNCAFLWEFPGGKREPGETLEQCAVRECMEELGIQIALHNWPRQFSYRYPEREIAFTFFDGEITGGQLEPKVHTDVRWVTPKELLQYEFCPADVELVHALAKGQ